MNKLQLLTAMAIIGLIAFSCNTKNNKKETTNKEVTKKVFDKDFLIQAALDGKIEPIKGAINNGFDVNSFDSNRRTALMLAAFNGHTNIVDLLIENGADVNLTDADHQTALMFASTGPFTETVTNLLKAGANPNMVGGEEKWSAVMWAAAEGQLEIVKILVANGADLNMVDVDGESSLDFANSKKHTDVVEYIKSQIK